MSFPPPAARPLLGSYSVGHSRKPLVIVRAASSERKKVIAAHAAVVASSRYYLVDEVVVESLRELEDSPAVFARIIANRVLMNDGGALLLPGWRDASLSERSRERLRQIAARPRGAADPDAAQAEAPSVALFALERGGLHEVSGERRGANSVSAAEWLERVWSDEAPTIATVIASRFSGVGRSYQAAIDETRMLLAQGVSRKEVRDHLTLYGFANPKEHLGRWSTHIDAVVEAATR